ncbi:MAG: flagellar hook-basal body complex protein [Alphaproteobacteria bacterium]|nr:flagellar hook-basal body complex protein [Alphaproteobacteria bacterium]
MSLWGAFNSSTNAMMAQSIGLGSISQNIANTNTNGYKKVDTEFKTMLSDSTPKIDFYSVNAVRRQLVDVQGQILTTGRTYDLGISGNGFFIVGKDALSTTSAASGTASVSSYLYTRDCSFIAQPYNTDSDASLESVLTTGSGRPVLGYSIDPATGAVGSSLGLVTVKNEGAIDGVATSEVTIQGNVDASPGTESQVLSIPVVDNAYAVKSLATQWTQSSPNNWRVKFTVGSGVSATPKTADATAATTAETNKTAADLAYENALVASGGNALDAGVVAAKTARDAADTALADAIATALGDTAAAAVVAANTAKTTADAAYDAAFAAAGANAADATVVSTKSTKDSTDILWTTALANNADPTTVPVSFTSNGIFSSTNPVSITVTWADATTSDISIDLSELTQFDGATRTKAFTQNGYESGYFYNSTFDETGTLSFSYTNGIQRDMYRLPLATFPAPNSLEALSGTLFAQSAESGKPLVGTVGINGGTRLSVGSVELSNVDIADEFTKMLVTQKAYSTAATAFKTADEMVQSASNLIR